MNPITGFFKGLGSSDYNGDQLASEESLLVKRLELLRQKSELIKAEAAMVELKKEEFALSCGDGKTNAQN